MRKNDKGECGWGGWDQLWLGGGLSHPRHSEEITATVCT